MIGLNGVGDIVEPAAARAVNTRPRVSEKSERVDTDGVTISTEAAAAGRAISGTSRGEEIRAARIEQAKENIAQGAYRVSDIVAQVASRIAPYVD